MELLTSLPAELVAVADPLARGPAPLLRPGEAEAESAAPPASFDALLALLTMPLPAGEAWPAAGKELPVVPLVAAAAPGAQGLDADAFAASADDAALLARLRLAPPPPLEPAAATAALAPPLLEAAALAQAPDSVQPNPAATAALDVDALPNTDLPTVPAAAEAEAAPFDLAELAAQTSAADPELPSSPDGSPPRDERASRLAAPAGEPRASAASSAFAAPAPAVSQPQPQPAAEAAIVAANGLRRSDAPRIALQSGATLAEAPSVSRPEWLPSGHVTATSAAPAVPSAPVDMRSPGWQDAMAQRVQWLVDSNVGEARITLHPPELGAVDIEISLVDDKTFVQLTASTAAARDELSQSLPRLRELFTVSGLELGGASVHDGRDGQRAGHGDDAAGPRPRTFAPLAELADELLSAATPRSVGRIDVFA